MLATGIQGEKERTGNTGKHSSYEKRCIKSICDTGNDRIDGAGSYKCCRRVRGRTGNCRNTDECQPYFCDSGGMEVTAKSETIKSRWKKTGFPCGSV